MKKMLMFAAIAAMAVGCSDDSDNNNNNGNQVADGYISSLTDPDYDANNLKGKINADITLPAGNYKLTGRLIVVDGSVLTLTPGSTFTADATNAGGGTNVSVEVNRGAKLMAVGTASAPIVFTSVNKHTGDWSGVFLCGKATLVNAASGTRDGSFTQTTELGDELYGGNNDADSSGHLEYVEIGYAGARINATKEGNNLSLYAQGTGTILKNLYLHDGSDDNIEFFGGRVNVENILVVNSADDTVDWCLGWTGTATNIIEVREAGFNDITNGSGMMEGDGGFADLASTPLVTTNLSNPTFTNISVGVYNANGVDSGSSSGAAYSLRAGFTFRTGCKVTINNGKVLWGSAAANPVNGLFKFNDGTGTALAPDVKINLNYTGANFIGQTGVITSVDSPIPGANYNEVLVNGNVAYPGFVLGNFSQLVFNNTAATGADKSAFAWTGYDFATKAPGL
ncbi:hypothetical protein HYN59_02525 [Flavobacterium album]|uniref:Multidrug transporter n=1 Tax=Flavobacterium album TaxID=2175091 RepID=A0A2S1QUJ2_9FLAO|nr:hypothetical protein [Flavobacterium album]AWH84054.1 hypothetical protein HYN59_02525 [Flavobacterium album]